MSQVETIGAVQFRSNIAADQLLDLPDGLWDLLPIGVFVCDRAGLIRRYNFRAAELWGREPKLGNPAERFSGALRLYRLDGGPVPRLQSPMADVLRSGAPIRDQEMVIERPDGSRIIASANLDALRDEAGKIVGAVSCFQDISARKRIEEEVRSNRRDLEDFFENSVAAMHLVAGDGTILRANQAEFDLLGYSREEYVGRHIAEFHADRPSIDDILARLSRGEKLDKHPASLRAKDGAIKQVIISSSAQFRDGEFVNTRCITLDMTAERAAETALDNRDRQSRALLDALPAALYTTDAEGRITYFNQAAAELAGREPTLGSDEWCVTWKLFTTDGAPLPHDQCPMAVALKEDRPVRGAEAIAERPDGRRVPFIPYPTPLHDDSGALIGAVNMLVDISDRKVAEENLRQSELRLSMDLVAAQHLQDVSAELVHEQDIEALYQKLVNAAAAIMVSDCASMQLLHPELGENGELELLASFGFTPQAEQFWGWVRADSGCSCGQAMRTGQRVIASDVATCDFMAGTEDRTAYLAAGIGAVQSTPLIARSGLLLGMISTHWRGSYEPPEGDLGRLDVLARLAADLIERTQAEEKLRDHEEQLRLATEAADVGLWDVDIITDSLFWPVRVKAMFGISPDVPVSMADFYAGLHPDDREQTGAGFAAALDPDQRALYDVEYRTVGKEDGVTRWVAAKGRGIFDANGICIRVIGTAIDITARKQAEQALRRQTERMEAEIAQRQRAEEQQRLLLREMSHRVKNLCAVASGVVAMSARSAHSPQEMSAAVQRRLAALTRAHDLVRPAITEAGEIDIPDTTLDALVRAIFEPYVDANEVASAERLLAQGPSVKVSGSAATGLALLLHELATNAAKYGALSSASGVVEISWSVGSDKLMLDWTERGGPPISGPPDHEGFGSLLARRSITGQLGGQLSYDWRPEGLALAISIARDRLDA